MGHRGIIKMKVNVGRENLSKTSTPGQSQGDSGTCGSTAHTTAVLLGGIHRQRAKRILEDSHMHENQKQSFFKKICNLKPPNSVSS